MGTHNICLYREVPVDKKYTGCILKTLLLLDCVLLGVCVIISWIGYGLMLESFVKAEYRNREVDYVK